jgi:hypothetical protein
MATLEVEALGGLVTRDVTFVVTRCGSGADVRIVPVTFDGGIGSTVLAGVDAHADWLSASEGHTLRRLAPLSFSACIADVDLTGLDRLTAGDFHTTAVPKDNFVDITDFSILAAAFNLPIDPASSIGADATGDGVQGTADFTAIQVNFFSIGDAPDDCVAGQIAANTWCNTAETATAWATPTFYGPRVSIEVTDFAPLHVSMGDLNGDGFVDPADIRAFAKRYRLKLLPEFEDKLERLAPRHTRRLHRQ